VARRRLLLNQSELATIVRVAEATVHQAMATLRSQGLVRGGYRKILILDAEALEAVGNGR
jgi:DNA-binding IclR family transcriptional regulator